jgi:hypothetical protein
MAVPFLDLSSTIKEVTGDFAIVYYYKVFHLFCFSIPAQLHVVYLLILEENAILILVWSRAGIVTHYL